MRFTATRKWPILADFTHALTYKDVAAVVPRTNEQSLIFLRDSKASEPHDRARSLRASSLLAGSNFHALSWTPALHTSLRETRDRS